MTSKLHNSHAGSGSGSDSDHENDHDHDHENENEKSNAWQPDADRIEECQHMSNRERNSDNSQSTKTELKLAFNLAFNHFDITIAQHITISAITGIYGDSGSGKSTLLRVIAGLEQRAKGQVSLNDVELQNSANRCFIKPEKRQIGLVFQDSRLFPHLTVYENLAYGANRQKNRKLTIEKVLNLTQLSQFQHQNVTQLSGGEKQRVSIARALLAEPKLLLLDEPFSALDKTTKAQMLTILKSIQQQLQLPMLYVSHSLSELQYIADQLVVVSAGKITQVAPIHQAINTLNSRGEANPKTSLSLTIAEHLPDYGLTRLALASAQEADHSIYLPLLEHTENQRLIGQQLPCMIYARDISISTTKPEHSSIVNHLPVIISAIKYSKTNALVTLNAGQQQFYAQISLWSAKRMALTIQTTVFIQFKANAVHSYHYTEPKIHA